MTNDYIPQPRPPLSDEAAIEILDFLYALITDFEGAYGEQIRRHYQYHAPKHTPDPGPAVADSTDPPF